MPKFWNVIDVVMNVMAYIAAILTAFLTIAISYATISRFFFGQPMAWVVEISCYSLVYITFLAAPWLLREDGHVKIDLIPNLLPPEKQSRLKIVVCILGLTASIILLIFGYRITLSNYLSNVITMDILRIPKYLLLIVIPFGSFFLVLQFLRDLLNAIYGSKNQPEGGSS